jgi:hypothetical protein
METISKIPLRGNIKKSFSELVLITKALCHSLFNPTNPLIIRSIFMSILFPKEKSIHTIIKKQNGKKCNDFGQDLHKGENIKYRVENLEFADCLNEKVKRLIKTINMSF